MGTGLRSFLTLFLLCAVLASVRAQKSAAFWDPAAEYKEALEIYDQQKYNIAYNRFEAFIAHYEQEDEARSDLLLADAHYYMSSCAAKQGDPKAEQFYLAYIERFKGHSFNNVAYFDLGNLYFEQRDYRTALEYYNSVDERALNKRFYEEFSFKRGFSYFSIRDFDTAKLAWQDVIDRPDGRYYHDANYYFGMACYFQEDYDAALEAFGRVDDIPRYRNVVPYYIAQIRFIREEYREVIEYAGPLVSRSGLKYKADINQLIGQSYFELGDYRNAVTYLAEYEQSAASLSKEDYYQLGYARYQTGDFEGAVESFKKLNHLNDALAQQALFLTANAYLQLGDKANARTALNRAASLDFDPGIVEEARFNHAKLSYELGFNSGALVGLRKFINDYPESAFIEEANELLAELLLQTRSYDEALAIIEKINNPSAKITGAYQLMAYHKGISLYNEGRLNRALEAFNKSLRYTPDPGLQALSRYWMGDINHRTGNYTASISHIGHFLSVDIDPDPAYTTKVSKAAGHYVQGYNYYKLAEYDKARSQFEMAANGFSERSEAEISGQLLPDALLRTADCYYLARQYGKSTTFYDRVIDRGYPGADYALYQKAAISGIRGRYNEKIDLLQNVMNAYPESVLADDALYETGNTYISLDNTSEGLASFSMLIQKYPSSEWVAPSYLKLGLIHFNQDRYEEALQQYKAVVDRFPRTTSSAEALVAIRDVYIAMGDPQSYIAYLETVPGSNVTVSEQDSILYLSAENLFTKGEYEGALKSFNDYLLRFPEGYFSLPAHYYRGECYFSFQEQGKAIEDYNYVLSRPKSRFTERSLQRAGGINYYYLKNYAAALEHYKELIRIASTEDNRKIAVLGILRSNFQLEDYRSTSEFADRVIGDEGFAELQQTEAFFYRARARWNTGDRNGAVGDYTQVRQRVSNEWAAEGAYFTALDHFESGRYDETEALAFEFVREYPSYASWLVRTYLLLADVYIIRDNLFQARATVQSILDNYKQDDQWRLQAETKYAEIERLESERSKIDGSGGDDDQLNFDE
jgi:tetratricopeptide (TPR) repeat protein